VNGDARPVGVILSSIALSLVGLVTGLVGISLSKATTIWGANYDGTYAVVGLLAGAALVAAAAVLWRGAAQAWLVMVLAASFPLMCAVGSLSSSDLSTLLPLAVVAWLALWFVLRRPAVAAWLRDGGESGRSSERADTWL
jgi:hypothetical protein